MIDGNYAALIYRDDKYFKVVHDINEVPSNWDRDKLSPMTWTEMFYISVYRLVPKTIAYTTRYPVIGTGSIYGSTLYLKTTITGQQLTELDQGWMHKSDEFVAAEMPILDEPFFDSLSVHPSKIIGLDADYDGDKTSLNIVYSDEAVKEGHTFLNSADAFLNPTGGLNYGINNQVGKLVLYNFTRGLEE